MMVAKPALHFVLADTPSPRGSDITFYGYGYIVRGLRTVCCRPAPTSKTTCDGTHGLIVCCFSSFRQSFQQLCPRASNGLLPPRSYLVDYVRWYARSDSVLLFLLQTIIPTAFSSQMVVPTAINSYGLLMRNRRGDSCAANSLRHAKVSTARQATQNVAIPIAEHPDCGL